MKTYQGINPGDSVGNRRSTKETKLINDDIGNHLEILRSNENTPDHIGNSIDSAPTHLLSGVTHRRKSDTAPHVRMGRYLVGGVNPMVAGLSHLIPETPEENPVQKSNPTPQSSNHQSEKRLRRLFEFEEDDRVEYTLSSTPEEKRLQAEQVVKKIFEAGQSHAEITTTLEQSETKTSVIASIKTPLFKTGELPLAALNFLVNKIVNRLPSDRIRLAVKEA